MLDTSKVWKDIKGKRDPKTGRLIFPSKKELDDFIGIADQLRKAMIKRGTIKSIT